MLAHKLKDREWGHLYIIGMAVMNHCEARTLNLNERVGYYLPTVVLPTLHPWMN